MKKTVVIGHYNENLDWMQSLPADTKIAPTINPICMPYLLSNQLQGTEKRGWAIVKSRALSVT